MNYNTVTVYVDNFLCCCSFAFLVEKTNIINTDIQLIAY